MLIHSGIIQLDYNPATDILQTSMPDVKHFEMAEVKFCLELIVDTVKSYDIKKLLLDSSNSVVEVEDETYKAIVKDFSIALMGTRLKKLARVGTPDAKREEKSAELSKDIKAELNLPIEFKTFATKKQAMAWLLG